MNWFNFSAVLGLKAGHVQVPRRALLLGLPCCMCAVGAAFLGSLVVLAGAAAGLAELSPWSGISQLCWVLWALISLEISLGTGTGHPACPKAPPAQLRQHQPCTSLKNYFVFSLSSFQCRDLNLEALTLAVRGEWRFLDIWAPVFTLPLGQFMSLLVLWVWDWCIFLLDKHFLMVYQLISLVTRARNKLFLF